MVRSVSVHAPVEDKSALEARGRRQAHHARLPAAAPCPHLQAGAHPSVGLPRGVLLIRGRCGSSRSPLCSCCSSAQVWRLFAGGRQTGRLSVPFSNETDVDLLTLNLYYCRRLSLHARTVRSGAHETIQVSLGGEREQSQGPLQGLERKRKRRKTENFIRNKHKGCFSAARAALIRIYNVQNVCTRL